MSRSSLVARLADHPLFRVGLFTAAYLSLAIWGAMHMAGGLVMVPTDWPTEGELGVLYNWWIIPREVVEAGDPGGWLKYDQAVHAYGFAVATWLCWQGLCGALTRDEPATGAGRPRIQPTPGLMLLVAAAGMGLGALNEIIEFIATRITATNVGGYVNTGWDLVYNAIGASFAATVIFLGSRKRSDRG